MCSSDLIMSGHTTFRTIAIIIITFGLNNLPFLAGMALLPFQLALLEWYRKSEMSCDRAGLLCCGSLDASTRSLTKLALGSTKLYEELNVEAFLDQHREGGDGIGRFAEMNASHPWLPKRVLALRAFAESELYRKHAGLGPSGQSMEAVDEKVHEIIKVWG